MYYCCSIDALNSTVVLKGHVQCTVQVLQSLATECEVDENYLEYSV